MSDQANDLNLEEIRSDEFKEIQEAAYNNDLERLQKRIGEFVHSNCPACGADDAEFKFEKYQCRFSSCNVCSTLFMSPRPTPEIMDEYYSNSENYAVWNKYIFPKSVETRRDKICKPNLEAIISYCKEIEMDNPQLIEIGPGFGTFASLAKGMGYFEKVTVIERNPDMVSACKSAGLEVIDSSLEDLGEKYAFSANVAVCFEVIEHIFAPEDFVSKIYDLLKPNGLFAFTCPNGEGFDTMMLQRSSPAVDTEHVNLFNPNSIRILLERLGFSIVSIETSGKLDTELVRRGVLNGDINIDDRPFLKKLLIEDFDNLSGSFQQFLIDNNLSGNMRVLAKKNV